MKYMQVCKALYDYDARTPDELNIHEDDILYILEKEDDDWWKVESKLQTDGTAQCGLVPANYLEECRPVGKVRAEYAYDAQQEEELSFEEGEEMALIECDDPDWFIVKLKNGQVGLAPSNYVQHIADHAADSDHVAPVALDRETESKPEPEPEPVPMPTPMRVPAPTQAPALAQRPSITPTDEEQEWLMHDYDPVKKKKTRNKGSLRIGNGVICYIEEKSSRMQQYSILDVSKYLFEDKVLHIEIKGAQQAVLDLSASSKSEAKAILVKITDSRSAAQAAATHIGSPTDLHPRHENTASLMKAHTLAEQPKRAVVQFSFEASENEELSVNEGEDVFVLDHGRTDGWYQIRNKSGRSGLVPATYVELQDGTAERQRRINEEEEAKVLQRQREEEHRRQVEQERQQREEEERRRKVHEAAQRAEADRHRQEEEEKRRKQSASFARTATQQTQQDTSKPDASKVRTWTDRSGAFKVDAQFLSFIDGKIRLHKVNGVKIDVPIEKMSKGDQAWVVNHNAEQGKPVRAEKQINQDWDWFDWFMDAGIPMQPSLVYSSSFKAERLDDSDIQHLTHKRMKTLGLTENHVQHIQRFIETGKSEPYEDQDANESPEPKYQSPKVSRPKPTQSAPKEIHPDLLEFIGTQLTTSSDSDAKKETPLQTGDLIGFHDDAWTPRPVSSAKSPTTAVSTQNINATHPPPPAIATSPHGSNPSQAFSPRQPSNAPPTSKADANIGQPSQTTQESVAAQNAGLQAFMESQWQQQQQQMQQLLQQQHEQLQKLQEERRLELDKQMQLQQMLHEQRMRDQFQQQQLKLEQQQKQQLEQQLRQHQLGLQQQAWQPQQLQSQLTGYAYGMDQPRLQTGSVSVPLSLTAPPNSTNAAGQPSSFMQPVGSIVPQSTGMRNWQTATPDNPFGADAPNPPRNDSSGVQFSTPNLSAFMQNPTQPQQPGFLQPQMTGFNNNFHPAGTMPYGQPSQGPSNFGRGW